MLFRSEDTLKNAVEKVCEGMNLDLIVQATNMETQKLYGYIRPRVTEETVSY